MTRKEDALVRLELHLTSSQCFRLKDWMKDIDFYDARREKLLQDEYSDERQKSIRVCEKWIENTERNIGRAVEGSIVLQPQKLDRAAAVAIWESALHSGKSATELIEILRSLQLKVIGHTRDPLGFFLREPCHQGLLQCEKVDSIQTSRQSGCCNSVVPELSQHSVVGIKSLLLTQILGTVEKALGVQPLGKREIQRTRSDTGNDELHSVLTIEGRTVVISVL